MVLHGEMDRATDPEGSKRFDGDRLPRRIRNVVLYPEGRHELLNDLERDAVLATILA